MRAKAAIWSHWKDLLTDNLLSFTLGDSLTEEGRREVSSLPTIFTAGRRGVVLTLFFAQGNQACFCTQPVGGRRLQFSQLVPDHSPLEVPLSDEDISLQRVTNDHFPPSRQWGCYQDIFYFPIFFPESVMVATLLWLQLWHHLLWLCHSLCNMTFYFHFFIFYGRNTFFLT